MSEDRTQNLPDDDLRQILTQVTSINTQLGDVRERLERLEARDYDTKPIWEDALKEIAELRVEVREGFEKARAEMDAGLRKVARQIDALNNNILGVQVELRGLDAIVSRLENQAAQ